MAYQRLSKEKQTLVLMALCEGMPIRACARMFKVGKDTIHRVIGETGEAFADYMDKEFRDLSCLRIELDEQWQYVGCHKGRIKKNPRIFGSGTTKRAGTFGFGLRLMPTRNWFSRIG